MMVDLSSLSTPGKIPRIKVTGMPGKHVPTGVLAAANDLLNAVRVFPGLVSMRKALPC
jgi:hypothetical protein